MRLILHICSHLQPKSSTLRYVKSSPGQIQYIYSSSYAGINIQSIVSPLRLVVYRQIDARYTPHLLPNKARNLVLSLCQHWSGQIKYSFISSHSGINIQFNVPFTKLAICRHLNARYTPHLLLNTGHISRFALRQF
jgi:hypothetical protein